MKKMFMSALAFMIIISSVFVPLDNTVEAATLEFYNGNGVSGFSTDNNVNNTDYRYRPYYMTVNQYGSNGSRYVWRAFGMGGDGVTNITKGKNELWVKADMASDEPVKNFRVEYGTSNTSVDMIPSGRAGYESAWVSGNKLYPVGTWVRVDQDSPLTSFGAINARIDSTSGFTNKGGIGKFSIRIVPAEDIVPQPPTINIRSGDYIPSGSDVTLSGGSAYKGIARLEYSVNGEEYRTYSGSFKLNTSGITNITARTIDNEGNISAISREVRNVDRDVPNGGVTFNNDYASSVDIKITATDSQSGVRSITTPDGREVMASSLTYTVRQNGTYFFLLTDNVGNATNLAVTISNIDTIAPTAVETHPDTYSKMVKITVLGSDQGSGVKSIMLPNGTVINDNVATYEVDRNGAYNFIITDKAGNTFNKLVIVSNVDDIKPSLNITPTSSDWSKGPVDYQIHFEDKESGMDANKRLYKITNSSATPTSWDTSISDDYAASIEREGIWYIHAKGTDVAGNTTELVSDAIKIQKPPITPQLSIKQVGEKAVALEWPLPDGSVVADGTTYDLENITTGQSYRISYPTNSRIDSNLSGGKNYEYRIRATNHVGQSPYSTVVKVMTLPEAPQQLQLDAVEREAGSVLASYDKVATAEQYRIVATSKVDASEAYNKTVTGNVYQQITGLSPGTLYDIAVYPINISGEGAAVHSSFLSLPDVPGGFSTIRIGQNDVDLSWNTVTSATYYALDRDRQSIYEDANNRFLDQGLKSGTRYDYRVSASNPTGLGDYARRSVITLPGSVENLRASTATETTVDLQINPVHGADYYLLSVTGDTYTSTQVMRSTIYKVSGLQPGNTYKFDVTAVNESGSGDSAQVIYATLPDRSASTHVSDIQEQSATIHFESVKGASKYKVHVNQKEYELNNLSLPVEGLAGGTEYTYTIEAGNASGYGKSIQGTFLTLPAAPDGLAMVDNDSTSVTFQWEAVKGTDRYVIEDVYGNYLADTPNTTFKAIHLDSGTSYTYIIKAINQSGTSKPTAFEWTTVPSQINQTDVSVDPAVDTAMINWKSVNGASKYKINVNQIDYELSGTQLDVQGLTGGTDYTYTMEAGNASGYGKSVQGTFLTRPAKPDRLEMVNNDATSLTFKWDSVKSAESYVIEDVYGNHLADTTATSFEAVDLTPGENYTYSVTAINRSGRGETAEFEWRAIPSKMDLSVSTTKNAAMINWKPLNGANKYKIKVDQNVYELTNFELLVEKLIAGTNYDYTAAAGNDSGYGSTTQGTFLTFPAAPDRLAMVDNDSTSVTFKWDGVKSADHYVIEDVYGKYLADTTNAVYTADHLTPGENYTYSVTAINRSGRSESSQFAWRTIPGKINQSDIKVSTTTDTATITWKPVEGSDQYQIYKGDLLIAVVTDPQYVITDLDSSTKYDDYTIVSVNSTGQGAQNKVPVFYTKPSADYTVDILAGKKDLTFTITPVKPSNEIYVIEYLNEVIYSGKSKTFKYEGLRSGKTYDFMIRSENEDGDRSAAKKVTAKTLNEHELDPVATENPTADETPSSETIPTAEPSSDVDNRSDNDKATTQGFSDIDSTFNKDQIEQLAIKGIIKGTTESTFEPERAITRAEFMSLVLRVNDYREEQTNNVSVASLINPIITFQDVSNGEWYYTELERAYGDGMVKGFSDKEFQPMTLIKREQAVKMISGAMPQFDLSELSSVTYQDEQQVADWAVNELHALSKLKIVIGYPDGNFKPQNSLTRAEAAALLWRYDQLLENQK